MLCSTLSQKASDNFSACHHFDGALEEYVDLEYSDTEYSSYIADEDSEYIPD
jgi:hypothetical protein